jgi:hypothetical protein
VTNADQQRLYLTVGYGYADQLLHHHGVAAQRIHAENERLRLFSDEEKTIARQMAAMAGLPPPDWAR